MGGKGRKGWMGASCLACLASVALTAQADEAASHLRAAAQAVHERRLTDAIREIHVVIDREPGSSGVWYAIGQIYDDISSDTISTFVEPADAPWRQLLLADALAVNKRFIDAFALYREVLDRLPSTFAIHDGIARVYEQTAHKDWAERERAAAGPLDCEVRKAFCELRAGRADAALAATASQSDAESRYVRARAAAELSRAAFRRLDDLDDSVERRVSHAALARSESRVLDAIAELRAALALAPGHPAIVTELAASYYEAQDYEQTVATLAPLAGRNDVDARVVTLMGYSLLRLRRIDEAVPLLERAVERAVNDRGPRLALGRAYVQTGRYAAAIPLLEPLLADDKDGSLHVQVSRAYRGIGDQDKSAALLRRSEALQRSADEVASRTSQRTITPPR
jgi:predicted Zn-dependent protease